MDKRCKIAIFMGLTDPEGPHHKRQSIVTPFIRAGTLKPLGVTTIGGRS